MHTVQMHIELHMAVYNKTLRGAFVNNLAHREQDINLSDKSLACGRVVISIWYFMDKPHCADSVQ